MERDDDLLAKFVKIKSEVVTKKVNEMFTLIRWKMFNTLLNGGVEPCCELTVKGVPYSDLNTGGRINAGREIISVLCSYYDVYPPVFTDNAEAVTGLYPLKNQCINLIVSESDKVLRIE